MKRNRAVVLVLLALVAPAWWRATNSHAAARRGEKAFGAKDYPAAVQSYGRADAIDPSALSAFNLGTAQIAGGARAAGSKTLERAAADPALAADALFNRGNAAFTGGELAQAIRAYQEALRRAPSHAGAKRNLEIALANQKKQQQQGQQGGQKGNDRTPQQKQTPAADGQRPKPGELDMETLLRSVQQQEQEELRRMKGKGGRGRIGW